MMRRAARIGFTLVEVTLMMVAAATVAMGFAGLALSAWRSLSVGQDRLAAQQAFEGARAALSRDVQAGCGLSTFDAVTGAHFTVQQPAAGGTFRYVSWRLQEDPGGRRLQRGTSTASGTPPAAWSDVIDPALVRAQGGAFTFYDATGAAVTDVAGIRWIRRVALGGLTLSILATGDAVAAPTLSAAMREGANARAIVLVGTPTYSGNDKKAEGTVHCRLDLANRTGGSITMTAFAADWHQVGTGNTLKSIDGSGSGMLWNAGATPYHDEDPPQPLDDPLVIEPASPEDLEFHFMYGRPDGGRITHLDLRLYAADDPARKYPYLVIIDMP